MRSISLFDPPGILAGRGVDGVHVDHWHLLKQDLGLALDQLARLAVEAGALEEEAVDVDTLGRSIMDVFPREPGHQVLQIIIEKSFKLHRNSSVHVFVVSVLALKLGD